MINVTWWGDFWLLVRDVGNCLPQLTLAGGEREKVWVKAAEAAEVAEVQATPFAPNIVSRDEEIVHRT